MTSRSKVSREILAAAPRLRGVVFPSIGTESLDLAAATELGIIVAYGPTPENFLSMAEATVMLMTVLFYDLPKTEAVLRENQPRPKVLHAQLMLGKTIGLIGMGRIARAVVERLAGWRMRVLAFDPHVAQAQAPPGVVMTDLPSLLRQSDLVSLHATLSSETRHLIGRAELALDEAECLSDQHRAWRARRRRRIGRRAPRTRGSPVPPWMRFSRNRCRGTTLIAVSRT